MTPFDPECITARDLRDTLRRMVDEAGMSATRIGDRVGVTDDAVLAWLRGEHLKQPVQLFAVIDALGYDVVFRKRGARKRSIRMT